MEAMGIRMLLPALNMAEMNGLTLIAPQGPIPEYKRPGFPASTK
jgi:hypothetical protein